MSGVEKPLEIRVLADASGKIGVGRREWKGRVQSGRGSGLKNKAPL